MIKTKTLWSEVMDECYGEWGTEEVNVIALNSLFRTYLSYIHIFC
jgi:hypothetical protein